MNTATKHVASRMLTGTGAWQNSAVPGDEMRRRAWRRRHRQHQPSRGAAEAHVRAR
jgi:hypothetical protein